MIRGVKIARVQSCKYLGVYVDCYLRWDIHINYIVGKTKYLLYVFHKLKKVLAVNCLKIMYFALFLNIASFGIISWGGASHGVMNSLQLLQNRLTRFLSADSTFLSLNQNFVLQVTLFHFKNLQSLYQRKPKRTTVNHLEIPHVNKSFIKNPVTTLRLKLLMYCHQT